MENREFEYTGDSPEDIIRQAIVKQVGRLGGWKQGSESFTSWGRFDLSDGRKGSYVATLKPDESLGFCNIAWDNSGTDNAGRAAA